MKLIVLINGDVHDDNDNDNDDDEEVDDHVFSSQCPKLHMIK